MSKQSWQSIIKRTFLLLSILVLCFVQLSSRAVAISAAQQNIYDSGIYYFDVDPDTGTGCLSADTGTGPLSGPHFPKISDPNDLATRIKTYINSQIKNSPLNTQVYAQDFVKYGQKYNINPAMIVAIGQKETGLGTTGNGTPGTMNVFNNRSPDGSFGPFPSYEASIENVNKLLAGNLYLGAPSNFTTIKQIMYRYAPPSDNNETDKYIAFIGTVMGKIYGDISVSGSTSSSADASTGDPTIGSDQSSDSCVAGGVVAGSIIKTALGLAWPKGGHGKQKSDATNAYQTAMPQTHGGDPGNDAWSDCGVFVSTVIIASGADKNYVQRGSSSQENYMHNHPKLYKPEGGGGNITSSAQVQPGDIFVNDGHTFIYVGPQPGGNAVTEASWGDHVPQLDSKLYFTNFGESFRAFQLIGGGTSAT